MYSGSGLAHIYAEIAPCYRLAAGVIITAGYVVFMEFDSQDNDQRQAVPVTDLVVGLTGMYRFGVCVRKDTAVDDDFVARYSRTMALVHNP